MGWEWRGNRAYYYQAARVGGRVVKQYFGAGEVAGVVSRLDGLGRVAEVTARSDRAARQAARADEDRRVLGVLDAADAVLGAWLPAAGFHRPKRGAWRRKRGFTGGGPMELATRKPFDDWDFLALARTAAPLPKELAREAGRKVRPDTPAVAEYLAANPSVVAVFGDLTRHTVEAMADKLSGGHGLAGAAIRRRVDGLRRTLAGDDPTPVEVLLAERAAVCWLSLTVAEASHASSGAALSFRDAILAEKRIDGLNRRFLSSLRTLAVARRLRLPDLLAAVAVSPPPADGLPGPGTGEAG